MSKKEKTSLEENLKKKIKEFSALYEVGKCISSTSHLDEILKFITKKVAKIMKASSCSLRLLDSSRQKLVFVCGYGFNRRPYIIKKNLKVGEGIAGRLVKKGTPYIINDLFKEKRYKYFHLPRQKNLRSLVAVPIIQKNRIIGVLSIYNKKPYKYSAEDARVLSMFATQAAIAIENAGLFEQAEMGYLNTIKTLSDIIDAKDSYTYGHSERVMQHCMEIADVFKLSEHDKKILKYASLLHDVGKIGIDIGILRKPSKLNDEEWKAMVMHPILGSSIVEQIGFLKDLAPIILRHHERYDGKGYPGRLKKKKIPIAARMLSVADAYESMMTDRPYRKALSLKKARQELLKGAGTQFDPRIVKIFLKVLDTKKHKKRQSDLYIRGHNPIRHRNNGGRIENGRLVLCLENPGFWFDKLTIPLTIPSRVGG